MDLLKLEPAQMAGIAFDCACGRHHKVDIGKILIGSGVSSQVAELAAPYKGGKVFLYGDQNTWWVLGRAVNEQLNTAGFQVKSYVFSKAERLVPDEKSLGRLLIELEPGTDLIIAVGSGTLNDLGRMLSARLQIPYFIVATAPSMDGYASTVSPLIVEGFKTTYEAVYPKAIIADTEILKDAPLEMLQAGFGDIIGKYNALTDWVLSRELNGEYYCETIVSLVEGAIQKCVENMHAVQGRDEQTIQYIIEALVLSGVAMGMAGNSRPASGAEHHMAHYWEMDALKKGEEHPLHGNAVGAATVVMACVYESMTELLPEACKPQKPEEIAGILRATGAADSPKSLGISRELFHESVLNAKNIRPRYTILQLAANHGLLEGLADSLTRRFYD